MGPIVKREQRKGKKSDDRRIWRIVFSFASITKSYIAKIKSNYKVRRRIKTIDKDKKSYLNFRDMKIINDKITIKILRKHHYS